MNSKTKKDGDWPKMAQKSLKSSVGSPLAVEKGPGLIANLQSCYGHSKEVTVKFVSNTHISGLIVTLEISALAIEPNVRHPA